MASDIRYSTATLNGFLDTINTRIGASGRLRIYDGTKPTNADTALGAQVKLADLALSATAFAAASSRSITANAITTDTAAVAGTASWATFTTSGGTRVMDVTAGVTADSPDLVLDSKIIQTNADVAVTSCVLTLSL